MRARARRPRRRCRAWRAAAVFGVPRGCCSPCCSAARCICSGSTTTSCRSRAARAIQRVIEVPAHRGRIVDRNGEPLAISTPVKSMWVFRDKVDATPEQLRKLARVLETTPQQLRDALDAATATSCSSRSSLRRRRRERAMALGIKGILPAERIPALLPGRRSDGARVGFTGDRRRGPGRHRARAAGGLGGKPGSRRVIKDRRGDIVEDVDGDPRAAGRPRPRAVDRRADPVPRVSRAEGRGRAQQGEGRRPRGARRADRRSPRAGELADVQPEQPRHGSRASRCATARSPTCSSRARR